jgi:hypothetical protein
MHRFIPIVLMLLNTCALTLTTSHAQADPSTGFKSGQRIEAGFYWPENNKNQILCGGEYARWDIATDTLDEGYPKAISAGWKGLPNNLDAAIFSGVGGDPLRNKVYLFKGNQYWRWDVSKDTLDDGYPKPISAGWKGLPNDLDAAIFGGFSDSNRNQKLYFFKGNQYWRWDIISDTLDEGYPKPISVGWKGLPNDLDAAFYGGVSSGNRDNKLYFFKGNQYWRWDITTDTLDEGYPKTIDAGWKGLLK